MSPRVRAGFVVGLVLNLLAALAILVIPHQNSTAAELQGIPVWGAEFMVGNKTLTRDEAVAQAQQLDLIAATKGMYRPYVSAMKAANPDLTLLVYLNGTFAQSNEGTAYPEAWYQLDANGNKIRSVGWGNYLMDPTNQGWIDDVSNRCANFLAESGYDGCILDVLGIAPLNPSYVTGLPQNPATGKVFTSSEWLSATSNIAAHVTSTVSPRPVFGNGLMFGDNYFKTPGATSELLGDLDGGMSELFMRAPSAPITQYRSEVQWKRDVDMLVDAASRGDAMVTTTKVWTTGTQAQFDNWHSFSLASFLLGYEPGKSYFTFRYDRGSTYAHRYWDAPIGTPVSPYTKAGGIYQRTFTGGRVLVNPSAAPVTVDLGGTFKTLEGVTASTITLPPHSGDVLTRPTVDPGPSVSPTTVDPGPSVSPPTDTQNPPTQSIAVGFTRKRSSAVTLREAVGEAQAFDLIVARKGTFKNYVEQMRAVNPDLILLAQESGVFQSSKTDRWGTLHPDSWYARDCAGHKLRAQGDGGWLMDVRNVRGRWYENRVSTAAKKLTFSGYDGIFLDSIGPGPANGTYVRDAKTGAVSVPVVPGTKPCVAYSPSRWLSLTGALASRIESVTNKPVYGNGLGNGRSF